MMVFAKYGEFVRILRARHQGVMSDMAKAIGATLPFLSSAEGEGMKLVGRLHNRGIHVAQNRVQTELWLAKTMRSSDADAVEEATKGLSVNG